MLGSVIASDGLPGWSSATWSSCSLAESRDIVVILLSRLSKDDGAGDTLRVGIGGVLVGVTVPFVLHPCFSDNIGDDIDLRNTFFGVWHAVLSEARDTLVCD